MRISRIEFENFRNFRDQGRIDFATDGRVTIIYGKNGDGKTTLHQLMQWIIYGRIKFNKTTTETLYNLSYGNEAPSGSSFTVWGRMYFIHNDIQYVLHRTATYQKSLLGDISYQKEDFELWMTDEDSTQKKVENPVEAMEKLLPSGLSDYFFFDGESMIADLRVKGDDSAKKLRKALYSIFDLDILEMAVSHIGDKDHKETVIGKLNLTKGGSSSDSEVSFARQQVESAQNRRDDTDTKLREAKEERKMKKELILSISEQIGSTKSKAEYERIRKSLVDAKNDAESRFAEYNASFGEEVFENYPRLMISKAISDARKKLHLKVEQANLPDGISKELIDFLLDDKTTFCICGSPICEENRKKLLQWKELLPPQSYALLYSNFTKKAASWGKGYSREKLESIIQNSIGADTRIDELETQIRELDDVQKKSSDISDLIEARAAAEKRLSELEEIIVQLSTDLQKAEVFLRKANKEFDTLTKNSKETEAANRRIEIMENVKKYFSEKLQNASVTYSQKLQSYIQGLLNTMLTTVRTAEVKPDFSVRIKDSNEDESKSEGQFAVSSFAYIGGILKLLQSEESLQGKEYPLVLDGPFSKLDEDQRQNVVDTIPQFAPQVILFSKDNLEDVFDQSMIARRWTIESNAEKNIAVVKEGFRWN